MRWAVLGSKGMLGSDLLQLLRDFKHDAIGFHRENIDFASSENVYTVLSDFDVVVNCIAFTNVELAEKDPEAARFANIDIPAKISNDSAASGSRLIHISTDYVFSGTDSSPYLAYAPKAPLGVYGKTKSEGEDAWLQGSDSSQVIRTAWLYGANGNCFPKTIASKLLAGESLNVVDDQNGSPTWTLDLSRFIVEAGLSPVDSRIMHGVPADATTWFTFANAIAEDLDKRLPSKIPDSISSFRDLISPILSESYQTLAQRPCSSILAPTKIGHFSIADWRTRWQFAAPTVLREFLD